MAQIVIWRSDVFDPLDNLNKFIDDIIANKPAGVCIDEEGRFKAIESWPISATKIHVCISGVSFPNIQYNFIIDKEVLVNSIRETYKHDFIDYISYKISNGA